MKNALFTLAFPICLLCSLCASGQKIHITDTSNLWITRRFVDGGLEPDYYDYINFKYKDTIVNTNGHTYNYLQIGNNSNFSIREEGNKVFLRAYKRYYSIATYFNDTTNEFLYFDYDLQVNDTLTLPITDGSVPSSQMFSKHVVLSIDSTEINNTWHKRFHMNPISGFDGYYEFIEGIGTYWGPIITSQWVTSTGLHYIVCFKNNNTTPLSDLTDCNHITAVSELGESGDQYFHIYPNPANEEITIDYSGVKNSKYIISILDLSGKVLLKTTFQSKKPLDISKLLSGMYIIQIADENGILFHDKMIIRK
ncbi:T9SS type A sorting domain-containing protein [Taibaiella lutea]|uniref:T9SS type A sorting domain-containing protein n=1 Tax=Taibaiella lutea TaxID=2608001 RepID=A0A5M6CHQ9_9BACT|nr:T9SS type A sorting domain-containing protein [Taibaiella lutea]KAA5534704.1 T9SS type A sorting domain-containing protein [Taibaiella lutea]